MLLPSHPFLPLPKCLPRKKPATRHPALLATIANATLLCSLVYCCWKGSVSPCTTGADLGAVQLCIHSHDMHPHRCAESDGSDCVAHCISYLKMWASLPQRMGLGLASERGPRQQAGRYRCLCPPHQRHRHTLTAYEQIVLNMCRRLGTLSSSTPDTVVSTHLEGLAPRAGHSAVCCRHCRASNTLCLLGIAVGHGQHCRHLHA